MLKWNVHWQWKYILLNITFRAFVSFSGDIQYIITYTIHDLTQTDVRTRHCNKVQKPSGVIWSLHPHTRTNQEPGSKHNTQLHYFQKNQPLCFQRAIAFGKSVFYLLKFSDSITTWRLKLVELELYHGNIFVWALKLAPSAKQTTNKLHGNNCPSLPLMSFIRRANH